MASEKRGFFKIIFTNESENAVVKVQTIAREGGDMLREFGGIRVLWGLRSRRLRLWASGRRGRERGFDAEAALSTASFGGRCNFKYIKLSPQTFEIAEELHKINLNNK